MDIPIPLVATPDLLVGSSVLLPTACTPSTGPANVDGRCILGGVWLPPGPRALAAPPSNGSCSAFPVYIATNVPYTSGRVAGSNYSALADIYSNTRLNEKWASRKPA